MFRDQAGFPNLKGYFRLSTLRETPDTTIGNSRVQPCSGNRIRDQSGPFLF